MKWARNHQRGRRNLTDAEVKFLRGQTYEAEKKEHGAPKGNKNNSSQRAHDAPFESEPQKTAEKVAAQFDVDPATIKRDAEFARAVNAIAENVGTEARDAILTGKEEIKAKVGERRGRPTEDEPDEKEQNFAELDGRTTRDIVAERAGFSNPETFRQAEKVVLKGHADLVKAMVDLAPIGENAGGGYRGAICSLSPASRVNRSSSATTSRSWSHLFAAGRPRCVSWRRRSCPLTAKRYARSVARQMRFPNPPHGARTMAKKKPTKKAKSSRRKEAKRGNRICLFLVKPGEATPEELSAIIKKAIDECRAERQAKAPRKRSKRKRRPNS